MPFLHVISEMTLQIFTSSLSNTTAKQQTVTVCVTNLCPQCSSRGLWRLWRCSLWWFMIVCLHNFMHHLPLHSVNTNRMAEKEHIKDGQMNSEYA